MSRGKSYSSLFNSNSFIHQAKTKESSSQNAPNLLANGEAGAAAAAAAVAVKAQQKEREITEVAEETRDDKSA